MKKLVLVSLLLILCSPSYAFANTSEVEYQYNENNRLEKMYSNDKIMKYFYDDNGNLLSQGFIDEVLKLQADPQGTSTVYQKITLERGKTYSYTFNIYFKKPAKSYNGFYWYHLYSDPSHPDHEKLYFPGTTDTRKIGEWQTIEGTFTVPDHEDYHQTRLFFRGHSPSSDFEFYIDDFVLYMQTPDQSTVIEDFHDLDNWYTWISYGNTVSPAVFDFMEQVLRLQASPQGTNSVSQNVLLEPGRTYSYEYQIYFKKAAQSYNGLYWFNFYSDSEHPDHEKYHLPPTADIGKIGEWQTVKGTLSIPDNKDYLYTRLALRGHSPSSDFDFYIDNFVLYEHSPKDSLVTETFSDLADWFIWTSYGNTSVPMVQGLTEHVLVIQALPQGTNSVSQKLSLERGKTYTYVYQIYFHKAAATYNGLYGFHLYSDTEHPNHKKLVLPPTADTEKLGEWQTVTGTLTIPDDEEYQLTHLAFRGHSPDSDFSFYIDNFLMYTRSPSNPEVADTFDGLDDWTAWISYGNTVLPEIQTAHTDTP